MSVDQVKQFAANVKQFLDALKGFAPGILKAIGTILALIQSAADSPLGQFLPAALKPYLAEIGVAADLLAKYGPTIADDLTHVQEAIDALLGLAPAVASMTPVTTDHTS